MDYLNNYMEGLQHLGIPTKNIEETINFYKTIGFELIDIYDIESGKVAFLKCNNITIETYENENVAMKHGSLDHFCINVNDIEKVFHLIKRANLTILDQEIQFLPFWKKGVRYFNILGPNGEKVEFGQIL